MFKIFSKIRLFYFILGILVISGLYYYFFIYTSTNTSASTKSTSSTEIVESSSIKDTVDAVWTSELVDEQSLRFNQAWTISSVLVKAWDKVTKWDVIATLDDKDWQNSVSQAQINLDNAKITLQELYKAVDESKILQAKNTIKSTEDSIEIVTKQLENLKVTQSNDIYNQEKNIETSKKDLENLKTNLETAKTDLETAEKDLSYTQKSQENSLSNTESNKSTSIKQIEASFSRELTSISKMIEQMDYILWVTESNKHKNDDYEMYLSAKDTTYKTQAENALLSAISSYKNLSEIINTYDNSWDISKLKSILTSIQNTYKILVNATDLTYKVLENSISPSSDVFDLDWSKNTIYGYTTTVQSKLTSINSSINTLNTLTNTDLISESNSNNLLSKQNSIKSKQSAVNSANLAIEKKQIEINNLEKTLDTTNLNNLLTLTDKTNNINQLTKTLEINKETYKELLEWPTSENVTKAKNSIAQAEINLWTATEKLDDYKLTAPFDWVIRKIDYMNWDNLTTDSDKYVYIENPDLLQVTVNLDQVDIAKVKVWTKATVTFDAYSTENVSAVITSIDTAPVTTSWVTSYKVTLVLDDKNFKETVLSWMTWDVELIVAEKTNVLLVSALAITTENNKSYVNLEKNWKIIKTEVITWLAISGKTEIVSWLSLWDKISITDYTTTSTSKTTTSTSLLNLWWSKSSSSKSSMQGPPGGF